MQYLNVIDLIMCGCQKTDRFRANEIWAKMSPNIKNHLLKFLDEMKFRSDPSVLQPGIRFEGAIHLMFYLPGTFARAKCAEFAKILTRYYAGDKTLLNDIAKNAESTADINMAAREAMADDPDNGFVEEQENVIDDTPGKKRKYWTPQMFQMDQETLILHDRNIVKKQQVQLIVEDTQALAQNLEVRKENFQFSKIEFNESIKRKRRDTKEDCSGIRKRGEETVLALQREGEEKEKQREAEQLALEKQGEEKEKQRLAFNQGEDDKMDRLRISRREELQFIRDKGDAAVEAVKKEAAAKEQLKTADTPVYDPVKHCTVEMVYVNNKRFFAHSRLKDSLLVKTGMQMADYYWSKIGLDPPTVFNNNKNVRFYNRDEYQNTILAQMKGAYQELLQREHPNQPTLSQVLSTISVNLPLHRE